MVCSSSAKSNFFGILLALTTLGTRFFLFETRNLLSGAAHPSRQGCNPSATKCIQLRIHPSIRLVYASASATASALLPIPFAPHKSSFVALVQPWIALCLVLLGLMPICAPPCRSTASRRQRLHQPLCIALRRTFAAGSERSDEAGISRLKTVALLLH